MNELLSSAEVAHLLGVSPASVKRWADSGLLPCVKTAGQHRRFRREAIERFRRSHDSEEPSLPLLAPGDRDARAWVDELLALQPTGMLESALLASRAQLGSWWRLCERLGAAVHELGERWARGQISIADEHVASERLARALARVGDWIPLRPGAPNCLLATATGDEHTLGLSLVELCLRERGWTTTWIGRSAPVEEISHAIARLDVQLVALSASAHSHDHKALAQQVERIGGTCDSVGVQLILGGNGRWPERLRHGRLIRDFASLTELLTLLGGV